MPDPNPSERLAEETRVRMSDGSAYVVDESHKRFVRRWRKALGNGCWILVRSQSGNRRLLNPCQIVAAEEL